MRSQYKNCIIVCYTVAQEGGAGEMVEHTDIRKSFPPFPPKLYSSIVTFLAERRMVFPWSLVSCWNVPGPNIPRSFRPRNFVMKHIWEITGQNVPPISVDFWPFTQKKPVPNSLSPNVCLSQDRFVHRDALPGTKLHGSYRPGMFMQDT
jgi:hypothetical protein